MVASHQSCSSLTFGLFCVWANVMGCFWRSRVAGLSCWAPFLFVCTALSFGLLCTAFLLGLLVLNSVFVEYNRVIYLPFLILLYPKYYIK